MALKAVPLVLGVGSAVAGGAGILAGTVGVLQIRKAMSQIDVDDRRLEKCLDAHHTKVDLTNAVLEDLGQMQELAQHHVISRMEDFLVSIGHHVQAQKHLVLDGVDGSDTQLPGMAKIDPDIAGWVKGLIGSVVIGAATPEVLRAAGTRLGAAGTGAAIKTLNGAARERALIAFFGGGPRAAGGGGMALGAPMLKAAGTGMALLAAGVVVKTEGTKALSESEVYRIAVNTEIAQLHVLEEILRGVRERAREQELVLGRLMFEATGALDVLESEPFDADLHTERLQVALIFVKSVGQVLAAHYENVKRDGAVEQFKFKYRETTTEATDD